jgi:hypothetical protein
MGLYFLEGNMMQHSIHLIAIITLHWAAIGLAAEEFVGAYVREHHKAYHARSCGLNMGRNGVIGDESDGKVGEGCTADPDGNSVVRRSQNLALSSIFAIPSRWVCHACPFQYSRTGGCYESQ